MNLSSPHWNSGTGCRHERPYVPAPSRPDGVHDRLHASLVMGGNYGRSAGEIDAAFAEAADTGKSRLLSRDFLVQTGYGEFEFQHIPAGGPATREAGHP